MTTQEPEAPRIAVPEDDSEDVVLKRIMSATEEVPFYRSLYQNVKDLIRPPKLPPLVLTSKPVEVKDIWGFYGGQEKRAGVSSLMIHGGVIALLIILGTNRHVQQAVHNAVTLVAPDLNVYKPAPPKRDTMGGGGGGGDRS